MHTLSEPTLGHLVQIAVDACSRDELATLLFRADLERKDYRGHDPGGSSKHGLVRARLRGAGVCANSGDRDAHRALLAFIRLLLTQKVRDPEDPPQWLPELRESLLGDGFDLVWDREEEQIHDFGSSRSKITVVYRILPTDSSPAPLSDEMSALERELRTRDLAEVAVHYRQAVVNLAQHHYEAANGQLRTALEALVVRLAADHAQFTEHGGGRAIEHLIAKRALPERGGGWLVRGLWQMAHSNGSHPGQSTADEARMRMQLVTATARFLLNHFPA